MPKRGRPSPPPGASPGERLPASPARRKWLTVVLVAALLILAAGAAVFRSDDTDLWFHLAAGRSIAAHGLPSVERWTVSAAGARPSLPGWAFHLALWEVFRFGGWAGLALWRAVLSAGALALALAIARGAGARSLWALGVVPLVIAVTRDRLNARTEQAFLLLLLFAVWCFESARRGRDRTLWTLPAQAAWVNVHPSWIFGPGLAWLYALDAWWLSRGEDRRRLALRFAGLGLALAALVLLTPPHLDLRGVPFAFLTQFGQRDLLVASIEELRAWSWAQDRGAPFTAFLLLVVVAAICGGRRAWRASPPLVVIAIAGIASGLAIYRMRAVGALLALPVILVALDDVEARVRDGIARAASVLAAVAGLAWLALAPGFTLGVEPLWRAFPVRAVALADSLGLEGTVLNTFHFGGYILWARGETHPPLLDGRTIGDRAFRSRFERATADSTALDTLLTDWHCTHAILEPPRTAADRMAPALAARPDWTLVFADDAGLLFVENSAYGALASARGYRLLTPDYSVLGVRAAEAMQDSSMRRRLVAELERARAESPEHARATFWLGLLALAGGDARRAVSCFDEVERLAPLTPGLALRQGLAYRALGELPAARRAFRRATREAADADAAREALRAMGGD